MKSINHEQYKQHAFDSFCKKVLRNDARNYYNEMKRLRGLEVSFSELTIQELEKLSTIDKYFHTEYIFSIYGQDVIVNDEYLAAALQKLPQRKRSIILLSYFLDFKDTKIGKKLHLKRSTVQYQRKKALKEIKRILEEAYTNE